MRCPNCHCELPTGKICTCGYDPTRDYERRPTLSALRPKDWPSTISLLLTQAEQQAMSLSNTLNLLAQQSLSEEEAARKEALCCQLLPLLQSAGTPVQAYSAEKITFPIYPQLASDGSSVLAINRDGYFTLLQGNSSTCKCLCTPFENISYLQYGCGNFFAISEHRVICFQIPYNKIIPVSPRLLGPLACEDTVVSLAVGSNHIAIVREDGTAAFYNYQNRCSLEKEWDGIKQAAYTQTAGALLLQKSGAVVSVDISCHYKQSCYSKREIILENPVVQVAAGGSFGCCLTAAGTVSGVNCSDWQPVLSGWNGIVQIQAGSSHLAGLHSNGTVVACGDNSCGQCNVGSWTNVCRILTLDNTTIGIRKSGHVLASGKFSSFFRNMSFEIPNQLR